MEIQDSTAAAAAADPQGQERPHQGARIDWRTGHPMLRHDDAFWQAHEGRRAEQGLGIAQYCAANGLSRSTFRHRVNGRKRAATNAAPMSSPIVSQPAFVAVMTPPRTEGEAVIEMGIDGMTLRLSGAAAERVLGHLLSRLA